MDWSSIYDLVIELAKGWVGDGVFALVAGVLGYGWAMWKAKKRVPTVDIQVRKAEGLAGTSRIRPKLMVATFSGYNRPSEMDEQVFRQALAEKDLATLPVDENVTGMGQTVQLLQAYPTLEQLHLLTTEAREQGRSSIDAVPLLRAWAEREGIECEIVAEERYCISLEEDVQVTRDAYEFTAEILRALGKDYKPKGARILVDVTGGIKSMSTGALLACLGPDQAAHLIGARYDSSGERIKGSGLPLVIDFKPRGAHRLD